MFYLLTSLLVCHYLADFCFTSPRMIKAKADGPVSVFKLQFAAGEYDMVVADSDALTCALYEVKHSTEPDERQLRHLCDKRKLADVERQYGTVTERTVLYRGPDFAHKSGVTYRNVDSYLKSLCASSQNPSSPSMQILENHC